MQRTDAREKLRLDPEKKERGCGCEGIAEADREIWGRQREDWLW